MSGQPGYRLTARAALTAKGVIARGIGMVAAIGVLTTWGLTQHAALRLGFHAALGRPWLRQSRLTVANGGGTAKAIDYSLKRWAALSRYATDGRLPIDNNPVENAIRPIAIGKKNWLFVGSERAGKRAAAMQSLLATAKLNGLDPAAWLRETLDALPTCRNSQIDSLLPFTAGGLPHSVS